ncbi:hypothetical protein EYF80_021206 [Liparis tanakae]|uniref:Uncharacterized protein n=1 Tax=Liparis tanakae TaxID=230148 RepID=A0A4Z2HSE1_9TELE|nr:hypothetical protein EYF80_021206 [Liparis tanakae]
MDANVVSAIRRRADLPEHIKHHRGLTDPALYACTCPSGGVHNTASALAKYIFVTNSLKYSGTLRNKECEWDLKFWAPSLPDGLTGSRLDSSEVQALGLGESL